jgi:hypothetical protein
MAVIFENLLTLASGVDVLTPATADIFDQAKVSYEMQNSIMDKMGYVETRAINPSQTFSISIGAYAIDEIDEGQDLPFMKVGFGNAKGFKVRSFGNAIPISDLFYEWLKVAKTLEGADSSVGQEFANLRSNMKKLLDGARLKMEREATKVIANGWTIEKPTDATPYGQTLFASTHPYLEGTATFQNILGGSYGTLDDDLNATSLQHALNVHKSAIFLQNGNRVDTPSKYTLMVSRKLAVTARQILNTKGTQVSMFSGAGSNATQVNQFNFDGNVVEILENPFLGAKDGRSGETIGSEDMWFVINAEAMKEAKALRKVILQSPKMTVWTNNSNKNTITDLVCKADFVHIGAESFIVGSKGTA